MNGLTVTLRPLSAFGTPLAGDTLFGQLCWQLRLRRGEAGLDDLLEGYTGGLPFAIVSDAFPAGLLPRPTVPDAVAQMPALPAAERKAMKRRQWLPLASHGLPLPQWLRQACEARSATPTLQTQNTINRLTGTTGRGEFAPRQVDQIAFAPGTLLELHLLHDSARLPADELLTALSDIGQTGFGRDASSGLGKFEIVRSVTPSPILQGRPHRRAMTLAPCAPDPALLDAANCFYLPTTRFGRHGGIAALGTGGGPFKRPILLAKTGALLTFGQPSSAPFHGCGLGGRGRPLSATLPATVHQGYAPLLPLHGEADE